MKKLRSALFVVVACTMWLGCSQSDTAIPPDAVMSKDTTTSDKTGEPSADIPAAPASAQEVIQAMQARLEKVDGEATIKDAEAAIEIGKAGHKRFSKDENLTKALATLMYQSIRKLADQPEKLIARRLELGDMARTLVANTESLEQLGNMPSFLMLEEAKGYILNKELDKGWNAMVESRKLGFQQSKLLFMDPEFDPVVQDEKYSAEMKTWLFDEIDKDLSTHSPFPLEFSLKSLTEDGVEVSLADFNDKELTLIDFWGTWCPPCRAEVPHLVELQKKMQDRIAVVGVNFEQPIGGADFEETKTKLDGFQATQSMNYPCLYGDFEPASKVSGFQGFPTMLLVDKKGMVRLVITGYQPLPVLEATIERVLNN